MRSQPVPRVVALHRQGTMPSLEEGLQIKNVVMDEELVTERRFVIVRNPDATKRDHMIHDSIVDF